MTGKVKNPKTATKTVTNRTSPKPNYLPPCLQGGEKPLKGIRMKQKISWCIIAALTFTAALTGTVYANTSSAKKSAAPEHILLCSSAAEPAVAPEKNPPGDIPDSQVFVKYASSAYELDTPEGWARTVNGASVTFIYRFDGLSVTLTDAAGMPTIESIRKNQAEALMKTGRAVHIKRIDAVTLSKSPVIRMVYESNSKPDPVVNKQVRLENTAYFYYRNGKLAELTLWAPLGADNVDQWRRISRSFKWR